MLARDGTVQPHGHCRGAHGGPGGHRSYRVTTSMLNGDQEFACIDHLHEHALDPVVIDGGRYRVPSRPGDRGQMQPETLSRFAFAAGADWRAIRKG
jgi:hypothetical protein